MSVTTTLIERDERNGRFKSGNIGGPGRGRGNRNRLGEQFLEDLRDAWGTHGVEALRRCACEEPAAFVRVVASLMPKDLNINLGIDAAGFADKWRQASELLGHEVVPPLARRSLRAVKVIEHD